MTPKDIDAKARDAVHQGALLVTRNLPPLDISDIYDSKLVVILDQVTDPHNVGAIIRSSVALGAQALIMTGRHSPEESGILAKTASGGLDLISMVTVPNLARALDDLADSGFDVVGFDSEESQPFETIIAKQDADRPLALVFGSEGKGMRRLTREKCTALARLDMPGPNQKPQRLQCCCYDTLCCHTDAARTAEIELRRSNTKEPQPGLFLFPTDSKQQRLARRIWYDGRIAFVINSLGAIRYRSLIRARLNLDPLRIDISAQSRIIGRFQINLTIHVGHDSRDGSGLPIATLRPRFRIVSTITGIGVSHRSQCQQSQPGN